MLYKEQESFKIYFHINQHRHTDMSYMKFLNDYTQTTYTNASQSAPPVQYRIMSIAVAREPNYLSSRPLNMRMRDTPKMVSDAPHQAEKGRRDNRLKCEWMPNKMMCEFGAAMRVHNRELPVLSNINDQLSATVGWADPTASETFSVMH